MSKTPTSSSHFNRVRAHALAMPGAWEDHPWGESVAKVGKKVFVFFGVPKDGRFMMSVKLPVSAKVALERADCEPTGYGLGKSGWVSLNTTPTASLPPGLLERWIEESWCSIAPKKDVARWMGVAAEPEAKPAPKAKAKPKPKPKSKR